MAKTLGGLFLAAFVIMFIINGVYMLISPSMASSAWMVPNGGNSISWKIRTWESTDWDTDDRGGIPRWYFVGHLRLFLAL